MWMVQSGGCKISGAKKQSGRRSKKARWKATRRPSQLPSAVRHAPNSGRHGSRQSMEPKAVLEHRAPKTSPPILHSRGAESKAGRAVRCAPEWVVLTRLLGWNPAVRALTGAATARATLWVVKSACHALPTLTALRPRWPRAKSAQRGGESAGRAVHCAPV